MDKGIEEKVTELENKIMEDNERLGELNLEITRKELKEDAESSFRGAFSEVWSEPFYDGNGYNSGGAEVTEDIIEFISGVIDRAVRAVIDSKVEGGKK